MADRNLLTPKLYSKPVNNFLVIAHRGASGVCPENTMPAFERSFEMQADMIELDVGLSKDGVPVVFHDEDLQRIAGVKGQVLDFTLDELKKMDAGRWFSEAFAGVRIPVLEEVLEWASGKISLNIEIKPEAVSDNIINGVEVKCIDLVKKYRMEAHIIFSSFEHLAVQRIKKLEPNIPVAVLCNRTFYKRPDSIKLVDQINADAFNCDYRYISKNEIKVLRKAGIPVLLYTVNSERKMCSLIRAGVSGIFSDYPDLLRKVVIGEMT